MRPAFIRSLIELAENDDRINLLVGDLGFGLVEPYVQHFPDRFLNVGVAEQNLIGVAAGMAMCGKIVFVYSIANFPTLRCLEQIRNDVCHHNADVKIVSVGCGLNYGALGVTHHATEDVAVMRALPNMTVVAPGDPIEAGLATRALAEQPGPVYLRLGKAGEPPVHKPDTVNFHLGKAITVREGNDLTIIATGTMLHSALQAADRLFRDGINARVVSMHTVKPLDGDVVLTAARETRMIFTLEEHSILGGLGSAVAELLAESAKLEVAFKRIGIPNEFGHEVGNQDYLKKLYSLDVEGIARTVIAFLDTTRPQQTRAACSSSL
jgi:transketolase